MNLSNRLKICSPLAATPFPTCEHGSLCGHYWPTSDMQWRVAGKAMLVF